MVFIIDNPNDELIDIYESRRFAELIELRAEKKYSAEWKSESSDIPLMTQNPNYDKLQKLLGKIHKSKSEDELDEYIDELVKLAKDVSGKDFQLEESDNTDVRFAKSIGETLHCIKHRAMNS